MRQDRQNHAMLCIPSTFLIIISTTMKTRQDKTRPTKKLQREENKKPKYKMHFPFQKKNSPSIHPMRHLEIKNQ
jgi:hypothetical protein